MIPVRTFASHSAVWTSVSPLMEPFVRWINGHLISYSHPVEPSGPGRSGNHALIAELAFDRSAHGVTGTSGPMIEREATVLRATSALPGGPSPDLLLNSLEQLEVREISANIDKFVRNERGPARFRPVIPGCGVVDAATADILCGKSLVEIKAVSRGFRGLDVRQALCYAAMLDASGVRAESIVLLNPRAGKYVKLPLGFVSANVAGVAAAELLVAIEDWMSGLQVSA